MGLGTGSLCTFVYSLAYGGVVALYLTGAVMIALSLHRFIEGHRLT
jgi:hypothetical protein